MCDKTGTPDRHPFADKTVRLDPGIIPNVHIFLDLDKGTYKNTVPDRTAIQINRFDDRHFLTELYVPDSDMEQDGFHFAAK